jgi:DinB family protein
VTDLSADVALVLVRELEGFKRELALFPDDETIWKTAPGVTNSAANLALHLAGNLQYFIGSVLGGTGYVRNREAEFGRRSGSRDEIYRELDAATAVVRRVLPTLPAETLASEFPELVMGLRFRTSTFLAHLCAHAGFHLGQAGYLRRVVTGDTTSSGPIPLQPMAL